jgi:hypothetical protein
MAGVNYSQKKRIANQKRKAARGMDLQFLPEIITLEKTYDKRIDFQRIRNRVFNRQRPNLPWTFCHHDGPLFHVGIHDGFQ